MLMTWVNDTPHSGRVTGRREIMTTQRKLEYPGEPRFLSDHAWFYEERGGLHVVIQDPRSNVTQIVLIPWGKVSRAVDRHRKIKAAKVSNPT